MLPTKLYSETLGHGNNIVLLHGWGMHSGVWQAIAKDLAKQFRVTLIDLPGFGHNQIATNHFGLPTIAERLLETAPTNAIWIGWSLGGLIATWITIHFSQRVKRLINIASTPKFIKDENWPGISPDVLKQFANQIIEDYEKTLLRFLALQLHQQSSNRSDLHRLKTILFSRNLPQRDALLAGLKILQETDLRQDLYRVQCPTLQLFGRLDSLIPVSAANLIHNLFPDSQTVIIDGASHVPFISHPKQFLLCINTFLHEHH